MKAVPGHAGLWASEDGRILSDRSGAMRELSQRLCRGYFVVTVDERGERRKRAVHNLVCRAWHGVPTDAAPHVRHLDGVATNNSPANMKWGTPADNAADAIRHGTRGPGERARRLKLSDEQVRNMVQRLRDGEDTRSLAAEFGVSRYYPRQLATQPGRRAVGGGGSKP